MMTEEEARDADLKIAASLRGKLCEGCPPERFPDAPTRCLPCPRRSAILALKAHPRTQDKG